MKRKFIHILSIMVVVQMLCLMIFPVLVSAQEYITYFTEDSTKTYTNETGNYKRLNALIERGSVSSVYNLGHSTEHYNKYVRSAYDIKTGGAGRVSIEKLTVSHGTIYIQFFASDYTKLSSVSYKEQDVVTIPKACDFIRIEIATSEELENIVIRFYDTVDEPREVKRSGISEISEKLTYKVSDDVHTTSRLMLPPNYTIDGDKVPLILWLEGSGSSLSSWNGDFNSNKLPYLRYLRDEGFAVFSVYAWGNKYAEKYPKCGNSFPYPIPTNLECIKKGVEYICSRYNIDADNIHIMSKSQGGQCALYYASCNELNAKSIGMFAPVLDYLSMPGEAMYKDTRAAIADDLNFTGDVEYFASDRFLSYSDEGRAFLRENLPRLMTLNEAWTNLSGATPEELFESSMDDCKTFWTEEIWKTDRTDIYTHTDYAKTAVVPVKIWGAKDDAATPYLKMVEVVVQLKNGGSVAELRTLTGGHSCADVGSLRVNVTTALGIEHKNVPIGWVENIEWIRQNTATEEVPAELSVSADGPNVTISGMTDVKDVFIALGEYTTYRDVKNNMVVQLTTNKLDGAESYTYTLKAGGCYTVLVRYNDGTQKFLYQQINVTEPTFSADGLQLTVGNLDNVKVIRTAYGEYKTVSQIKKAEGARAFTAKNDIKGADSYKIQYRYNGVVTVAVQYNDGYTKIYTYEVEQKVPVFTQSNNVVTIGNIDDLYIVRYAPGEWKTSSEIKKAPGSVAIKASAAVDGVITVKNLKAGTYTFCVQYNDESYNYYTVVVE